MPDFNNIIYELEPDEKFALICGMIAGLRLGDRYRRDKVVVTLEPIYLGGKGTIGLMMSDTKYTGTSMRIPVITHDVNIGYSGFAVKLRYPTNRMTITSIEAGDFGPLLGTSINNGIAYAYAMLDSGVIIEEPKIMCWLNIVISDPPTSGNPINIEFLNSTGYDPDYCCLLQWVLKEDGNYYSYFITPTINEGGQIYSDEEKEPEQAVVSSQDIGAPASPDMISLGESPIEPSRSAIIPIFTNSSDDDGFPFKYNKFMIRASADLSALTTHVAYAGATSIKEWTLTSSTALEEGKIKIEIHGERDEALAGTSTPGGLLFKADAMLDSLSAVIDIEIEYCELINDTGEIAHVESVNGYPGYLYRVGETTPPGPTPYGPGGTSPLSYPSNRGSGSNSGITGGGKVWSGSSQTILIGYGGVWVPVVLEPGWNDVSVSIPFIFDTPVFEEIKLEIEIPDGGYILVPGGFIFKVNIADDAPIGFSSPRIVDKFKIKDKYDIVVISNPTPAEDQDVLDEYEIVDIHEIVKNLITTSNIDILETLSIDDLYNIYIHYIDPPVNPDNIVDTISIEDIKDIIKNYINTINNISEEDIGISDVYDIVVIHHEPPVNPDAIVDDVEIIDINDIVSNRIGQINKAQNELVEITDITSIEKISTGPQNYKLRFADALNIDDSNINDKELAPVYNKLVINVSDGLNISDSEEML